jgi:hypothetical protein
VSAKATTARRLRGVTPNTMRLRARSASARLNASRGTPNVRKRHSSIQSPCAYTGRKKDATTQSPSDSRATGARAARSIAGSTMSVRLSLYVRTKLPT